MTKEKALQIVYDLAEQNALTEGEATGDEALYESYKAQQIALQLVWIMLYGCSP